MESNEKIIQAITKALETGRISRADLEGILSNQATTHPTATKSAPGRASAVDIMFYIGGIVLFAATAALIAQAWDSGSAVRICLSAGLGTGFWALALFFIQARRQDDIRRGLTNALLLSGSLLLIAGGFIIASEFVSYVDFHFYATAITLLVIGSVHIGFGSQIKRDVITLIGILLSTAAFPTLIFGLLDDAGTPMYIYWLIIAASSGLLAYAARVVSKTGASSRQAARAFDSLSAFGVLGSLYAASFDDTTGIIWLLALIAGIVGLFYLSIVGQNKLMLGNGSLFLVIAIITISFRYFSGYGVATSLFISAIGLIGTAIMAAAINRRYIKT